jgi:transposase
MILGKVREDRRRSNRLEMQRYDNYVAVDWSIDNMAIAVMKRGSGQVKVADVPTSITELKRYLKGLPGKTIVTFEESTGAHWLYLELKGVVERVLVCDPYKNRLLLDGPKTDKIDATKLVELLKGGLLTEVFHVDDEELYKLRRLVAAYGDVVKHGVRSQNQRHSLIRALGSDADRVDGATKFISGFLDRNISLYEETKSAYEAEFEKWRKKNRSLKALASLDGIGPIRAAEILAAVIEPKRFSTTGRYLAYCGLVRVEKTSGKKRYGTRKPHYNRTLKGIYNGAAMTAINGDGPIREYYDYLLSKGIAEHNARVAVARYIARLSLGIMKSNEKYEPYRWRKNIRK